MNNDYAILDHQSWLGYLQPEGLVVSPAALSDAGVLIDRNAAPLQRELVAQLAEQKVGNMQLLALRHLPDFFVQFLGWPIEALLSGSAIPENLRVPMPEFGETLCPDWVLTSLARPGEQAQVQLLIQQLPLAADLDARSDSDSAKRWSASPSQRMERLLRETNVPIGLLCNGTVLRLIYAPRGENPGSISFPFSAMREVAGRPIVSALHSLLGCAALFTAPSHARLPALLKASRDYQARVSDQLSEQVLDALYELLRGFQAANVRSHHRLLAEVLAREPQDIYRGLLTVLMRLVFLLFAEDSGFCMKAKIRARFQIENTIAFIVDARDFLASTSFQLCKRPKTKSPS